MPALNVKIAQQLVDRLDEVGAARGCKGRSEVVRLLIREASMSRAERDAVPDREELLRLLGDRARDGSVTAMKALLDEQRRDQSDEAAGDPFAAFDVDELAKRRERVAG